MAFTKHFFVLVAALSLAAAPAHARKPYITALPPTAIEVSARPILFDTDHPGRTRFGRLEWRGGIDLRSPSPFFGGLSGLVVQPGNRLVAISDAGVWFTATLKHRDGRLSGVTNGRLAQMLGPDGKYVTAKNSRDSEGLSADGNGDLLVSFERKTRLARFSFSSKGTRAWARRVPIPKSLAASSRHNKGVEGIAAMTHGPLKGAIIAFNERALNKAGNLTGWLIGGPRPGRFYLTRMGGFDITDATMLPGGDLVVLERHFSPVTGAAMRLRRLSASSIRPGATVTGETLLEADAIYNIDNMEGVHARRSETGEIILTLISDDNFSVLQRTLLMEFAISEE